MGKFITEVEGLEILYTLGLSKGEEREKKFYRENGYINTGRSLESYLKKLEQIYTYAKLVVNEKTGKPFTGRSRMIELGEAREELAERIDGRKNNKRKPTEDEIYIYHYIFNKLLNAKLNQPLPYRGWATKVALFDVSKVSNKEFHSKSLEAINNLHTKTLGYDKSYSNEVLSFFKEMIYRRNEDVVKAAFSYLEGLGKIELTTSYHVYETNREYILITEEYYNQLKHEEEAIVSDSKMNIQSYRNMKNRPYTRTDFYLEVSKRVKGHMKEKHKINYYFTGTKVKLLCDNPFEEITVYMKNEIYKRILIKRTISRGSRTDYKHTGEFKKEWYTLNSFILLKEMGIDIPAELFDAEMNRLENDQNSSVVFDERLNNDIEETISMFG